MILSQNSKKLAVLIDPDKITIEILSSIVKGSIKAKVDLFLVGSSLLMKNSIDFVIDFIKEHSAIPVYIFPGNVLQISPKADGILLLSLISGRNPELLIGQHVLAAPNLKAANFDIIPTGYMLIDCGTTTSVEYISNTKPIPQNKSDIAICTAMAGEQLGMRAIYLEAGSGSNQPVSTTLIADIRKSISSTLIVGGGIKTAEDARNACNAGADIVVIGTAFEKDPTLIENIANTIHSSSL
jgi:putative glycerol-1-phosphate prenyltransferase